MQKFRLESGIIDKLPVAIYTCAMDGRITGYNRKAAELWGREPKLGQTDERFCGAFRLYFPDGDFMAHASTPMADCLATGKVQVNQEAEIERPDGSRLKVLVNVQPLFDDLGQRVGAVNVFHQISRFGYSEATQPASAIA